jgi:TP901 family phage tail tape measure protein
MRDTILDLATSTGTSASEIARVSKVLAQAGQRGDVLTESLTALSKVPLTPSFETIDAAVEGSIAALNQFNNEGLTTTEVLDTLTALSNNFAASSEDIAKGISRGGAAFEAIGGTFKEFASIFTTVRQATRESAETVGTFMKTISSRLADPKIVNFLEGKGIRIAESIEAGNPVGAIKEIAAALQNITSIQERVEIGTKLAGRRQISRLNALVSNIQILDETLATAGTSAGAFGEIAEVGLAGLQAQLNILGQEFNKLVQTLAEPLFIPIIRGVTTAGKAFVSMLEFIKPVIPALTTIVGLAAGFKLLAVSITAAGKALTFLSAAGIGGGVPGVLASLSGVAGGGQAANTARERIQRRLQGGVGAVGGGAAATATGVGLGARAARGVEVAASSRIGQLAAITGLLLVASKLTESFEEAGSSAGVLASSFVQATAVLLGAISLLSGQSVIGAIKSFVGKLTPLGTVAAGAIAAMGALAFASKRAIDIDVQSVVDAAKKRVANIKVETIEVGDLAGLEQQVTNLGEEALGGIQDAADQFSDGIFDVFGSTVSRLGNLFSGEGLVDISDADAQKIIDDIVGNNPQLLNEILRASIEEFGAGGFLEGIEELFAKSPEINLEAARSLRGSLIQALGGIQKVTSQINDIEIKGKANQLADAITKASNDFATLNIPTQLGGQLVLLSDAVGRAAREINTNANVFDKISQTVTQDISVIAPPTEFTREAAREIITQPDLGGFFGGGIEQLSQLTGLSQQTIEIQQLMSNFIKSIIASRAEADKLGTLLTEPLIDPVDVSNEFVDAFLEASDIDLPPESLAVFKAGALQIVQELKDGVIDAAGAVGEDIDIAGVIQQRLAGILGRQNILSESVITLVVEWLNSQALQIAKGVEGQNLFAEVDLRTATQAETVVNSAIEAAENLGVRAGIAFGDANSVLLDMARSGDFVETLLGRYSDAINRQGELFRENKEAAKTGEGANIGLIKALVTAGDEVRELDVLLLRFAEAARRAPEILREQGGTEEQVRFQEEQSATLLQLINRFREFTKTTAAVDVGQVFEEPAKIFAKALDDSTAAIKVFTTALRGIDIQAGIPVLQPEVTPEGRIFGSREAVPEAQIQTEQQVAETVNLQRALFGAGFPEAVEILRKGAVELLGNAAAQSAQFGALGISPEFETNRELSQTLQNFGGSFDQLLKIIADAVAAGTIDAKQLSELAASLTIEQAGGLGVGEIEKKAAERGVAALSKSLLDLLQKPEIGRDPSLAALEQLPEALLNTVGKLSDRPVQAPITAEPREFQQISAESASDIKSAAEISQQSASVTAQSAEAIKAASLDMKAGGTDILGASKVIDTGIDLPTTTEGPPSEPQQISTEAVLGLRDAAEQSRQSAEANAQSTKAIQTAALDIRAATVATAIASTAIATTELPTITEEPVSDLQQIPQESILGIKDAAETSRQSADAIAQSTEAIKTASLDIRTGGTSISDASQVMGTAADRLATTEILPATEEPVEVQQIPQDSILGIQDAAEKSRQASDIMIKSSESINAAASDILSGGANVLDASQTMNTATDRLSTTELSPTVEEPSIEVEQIPQESILGIQDAAEKSNQAADSTVQATESLKTSSLDIRVGGTNILDASQVMSTAINRLAEIELLAPTEEPVELQQIPQDSILGIQDASEISRQAAEAMTQSTELIKTASSDVSTGGTNLLEASQTMDAAINRLESIELSTSIDEPRDELQQIPQESISDIKEASSQSKQAADTTKISAADINTGGINILDASQRMSTAIDRLASIDLSPTTGRLTPIELSPTVEEPSRELQQIPQESILDIKEAAGQSRQAADAMVQATASIRTSSLGVETGGTNILNASQAMNTAIDRLSIIEPTTPTEEPQREFDQIPQESILGIKDAAEQSRQAADLTAQSTEIIRTSSLDIRTGGVNILDASQAMSAVIDRLAVIEPLPTTEEPTGDFQQISQESVLGIQDAAEKSRQAADATLQSTESIKISSLDIRTGGTSILGASEIMGTAVEGLAAVVDLQREVLAGPQEAAAGVNDESAREAIEATTNAVQALGERVDAVTSAIDLQTQQEAELAAAAQEESLVIDGLEENTEATVANNQISSSTNDAMSNLNEGIDKVASAMEEGIGIDIDAASKVEVDVQGVAAAAQEFTSEFEDVATRVAKAQIHATLRRLAAAANNSELAANFEAGVV